MSYLLKLDSASANTGRPGDFTVRYPDIEIHGAWEIALVSANLWYSYANIAASFGNNIIRYSTDSGVTFEANIIIPDGSYTVDDVNKFMQAELERRGHWDSVGGVHYITIAPNFQTLRVVVSLSNNYQIDFTAGKLNELFGFNPSILSAAETEAENLADITRSVNNLDINVDLTYAGYVNGTAGSVIYSFMPSVPPGYNIIINPPRLIYLPINKQIIRNIRVWITDNIGRPIDFRKEDVTYLFHIRRANSNRLK